VLTQQPSTAIRRVCTDHRDALERLAALDSRPVPFGDALIVELDGEPQAAIEIATGATVADPFGPTAGHVALLGVRAAQLRHPAVSQRLPRLCARATTSLRSRVLAPH
jgi:hypothetical protein